MAKGYRRVDRDQGFLLPPDMREWVPADDPVWLVIDAVAGLDTGRLHSKRKTGGAGRAGYDPEMLLTMLIWGWAQGQRSSRQLERLCHRDVTYRIICAGDAPDHVTISRFRADLTDVIEDLFTQVLLVCARVGLGRLGVVALDGVKIASNASLSANRTEKGLRDALAAEAARAAAEHAATDTCEDAEDRDGRGRGDRLPAGLADRSGRARRIGAALDDLAAHNQAQQAKTDRAGVRAQAAEQARLTRWQGPVDRARRALEKLQKAQQAKIDQFVPGSRGKPPAAVASYCRVRAAQKVVDQAVADRDAKIADYRDKIAESAAAQPKSAPKKHADAEGFGQPVRNITDPQSRAMPLRGGGWLQGFNCQAVTSSDGIIIATDVSNQIKDSVAFETMLGKTVAAAQAINDARADTGDDRGVGVLLADAGYLSNHNLTCDGPDRLIATSRSRALRKAAREQSVSGPPPDDATPIAAMAHRLATDDGHALYAQRSHIAETPFGHAKHNLGFRRFTSRGTARAAAEFTFHAMVTNLFKAINTERAIGAPA